MSSLAIKLRQRAVLTERESPGRSVTASMLVEAANEIDRLHKGIFVLNASLQEIAELKEFHRFCENNSLSWSIGYSDGSGHYEIEVNGIGAGEHFYVKKCVRVIDGLNFIKDQMRLIGLKWSQPTETTNDQR